MNSNPPDQKSERARWMTWARNYVRHWYGQAAVAALAALVCFLSMYSIYLYLSSQLPDGSKIYQKTGLYFKKNWERGSPTSSLGQDPLFCYVSAFSRGFCGFEGNGQIVTGTFTTFPRLWGDADAVLSATLPNKVLTDYGLQKRVIHWREQ